MSQPEPSWTWPWLLATMLARTVLATVVCLGLWGVVPALIGWQPTTVSSGSMLPRLQVGDVAVSRPLGDAAPTLGSVLLFDDPDQPGRLRLHRFVAVDDQGRLVTRGDANAGNDSTPIPLAAVHGIGTLRIPWVGLPVVWFREGAWVRLGLTLSVLVGLGFLAGRRRRPAEDPAPDRPPDRSPAGVGAARTVPAVALAAGLTLVLAAPAGSTFQATTTTSASLTANAYFSCANAITAGNPYLWYRLDETASTVTAATDSSGNGRTGSYSPGGRTAGATRACARRDTGTAMTFDGASGSLSSPQVTTGAPNTFTLTLWFRTTTTRGGKLIGFGTSQTGPSGSYDRHLYLTNTGQLVFGVFPNTVVRTISSPTAYNNGAWHHVAATLSTAGMRLYLNGSLVAADTATTTGEPITSGYWRIAYDNLTGWPNVPTSEFFAGTLDDVAVHPTALTATQVRSHYIAGT